MSALIHTMIGKHHLKLDMLGEFFEQSVTKMLDHYTGRTQKTAVHRSGKLQRLRLTGGCCAGRFLYRGGDRS